MNKNNKILCSKKDISMKQLRVVYLNLFIISLLGFLFFSLNFLPTFEAANVNLEKETFTMFEIAFGSSELVMNGLIFSSLITSFIASCLMLVAAILCLKFKTFSSLFALLIGIAFLLYTFTFVVFLLNPLLASYTFSVFETFSSLWTIYLLSLLLFYIVLSSLGLLIYSSIVCYQEINLVKEGN
ncbi:MAG: hypothetical protein WCZ47_02675 [Bacilli bacterium]|nr:hypothetical protein [Bacilli bacterium]NLN80136.1 hypothetical protein [Erysipelotrichia bacterium]